MCVCVCKSVFHPLTRTVLITTVNEINLLAGESEPQRRVRRRFTKLPLQNAEDLDELEREIKSSDETYSDLVS